ncbi:MAG: hypothetical protein ABS889_05475 [Desemzia incerta]
MEIDEKRDTQNKNCIDERIEYNRKRSRRAPVVYTAILIGVLEKSRFYRNDDVSKF